MSKRIGWAVRTVIAVLLFSLMFSWVTMVFLPDRGKHVIGFYEEPEESLDVLFVGSSPPLWGISPLVLWHEYGMVSYLRCNAQQPPYVAYNYLAEALETQSPELVVLYMPKLFEDYNVDRFEGRVRRAIDYTPFSRYKLDMIRETLEASDWQTLRNYIFPLLRYHDRWKNTGEGWSDFSDIGMADLDVLGKFGRVQHPYRGQSPKFNKITVYEEFDYSRWDESAEMKKVSAYSEEFFAKIVELLEEEGIPLLIIDMPRTEPDYGRHLAYLDLAERYQVDVLDLAAPEIVEAMGLDSAEDFYDKTHLSPFGSVKFSEYLGSYIREHYSIPDRQGESGMERWDKDYEAFMDLLRETRENIGDISVYPDEKAENEEILDVE